MPIGALRHRIVLALLITGAGALRHRGLHRLSGAENAFEFVLHYSLLCLAGHLPTQAWAVVDIALNVEGAFANG